MLRGPEEIECVTLKGSAEGIIGLMEQIGEPAGKTQPSVGLLEGNIRISVKETGVLFLVIVPKSMAQIEGVKGSGVEPFGPSRGKDVGGVTEHEDVLESERFHHGETQGEDSEIQSQCVVLDLDSDMLRESCGELSPELGGCPVLCDIVGRN